MYYGARAGVCASGYVLKLCLGEETGDAKEVTYVLYVSVVSAEQETPKD